MLNICVKFNFGFTKAFEVVVAVDADISNHLPPTPKGEFEIKFFTKANPEGRGVYFFRGFSIAIASFNNAN